MKKIAALCLLALVIAVPTFAYDGTVGLSIGPAFDWWTMAWASESSADPQKYSQTDLAVTVDGDTYIGNGFAAAYSLNIAIPLAASSSNGAKIDVKTAGSGYFFPTTIGASAGIAYKYDLTKEFFLRAGLGLGYSFGWQIIAATAEGGGGRFTQNAANAYIDLGGGYDFGGFSAKIGLKGEYTFWTSLSAKSNSGASLDDIMSLFKKTGFTLTPYIGAVYSF